MDQKTVLWAYIVLLLIGGAIGYWKGKSKVSLIMSAAFAVALSLCALDLVFKPYMMDVLMGGLLVVFGIRLWKTKKFMPAGLMLALTAVAMVLLHVQFR